MYQLALKGYKEALGQEVVKTYIPALDTAEELASLFQERRQSMGSGGIVLTNSCRYGYCIWAVEQAVSEHS
jgi:hypothetical protein